MAKYIFEPQKKEALLEGLGVYGMGGGGQVDFGRVILENDIRHGRVHQIIDVDDIEDDALVVSGGILGSVKAIGEAGYEKTVQAWETNFDLEKAVHSMERYFGRKVNYIVPFELGGLNTPVIMSLASRLGIPMLNADLLGRAAPETQMTSLIGLGVSLYPMVMLDGEGTTAFVEHADSIFFADQLGRWMVQQAKGMGANNHYPMKGSQAKQAVLPGTVTMAINLGQVILDSRQKGLDCIEEVRRHTGAYILGKGRVVAISEEDRDAFFYKRAVIEAEQGRIELTIKNEYMLARLNGKVVTIFPDSIMVLQNNSAQGVLSVDLAKGMEVTVMVRPCIERLRKAVESPTGQIAFSGDRYGEKDVHYLPVEKLLPDAVFTK